MSQALTKTAATRAIALLLFACTIFALWWRAQQRHAIELIAIPELISQQEVCTISADKSEQFYIYGSGEQLVRQLGEIYCDNPAIRRLYGSVKAFWGVSDENTLHLLGKGIADLVLVKDSFMQALKAEQTHGYTKLAAYPSYKAFFISLKEKPVVSKEYFIDKTIGLMDYPTSRSAHIIPKQVFKRLGLSLDKLSLVYGNSHSHLRDMLEAGEVDIIASYWGEEDKNRFYARYTTAISDDIAGASWYLRMAASNDELFCAVQNALLGIGKQDNTPYFKQIQPVNTLSCTEVASLLLQAGG